MNLPNSSGEQDTQRRTNQIVFLVCFYGKWPWYWGLWATSAAWQSDVDFIIVTDLPPPTPLPSNIRLIYLPLKNLTQRVQECIGQQLKTISYHKLCDLRPLYGLCFADLIKGYDYWGYCDVDLIFGNLAPLVERAFGGAYDLISPWSATVGHCTLVRNNPAANRIALQIPDYGRRLSMLESTFCDEGAFVQTAVKLGASFGGVDSVEHEWTKDQCFLGATLRPAKVFAGLDGVRRFAVVCGHKKVIVLSPGKRREVLYFHFMAGKTPRLWKTWDYRLTFPFSFTPYGYVSGEMSDADLNTIGFRAQSFNERARSFAYTTAHSACPPAVRRTIKRIRHQLSKRLS
jgi:hypothetical protein